MIKDVPVKRCFCLFSLRQGTMLIGIIVLLLSGFCLFLLLLGSAHAHEMATTLEKDIEDSAEREGIVLSEETEPHSHNDVVLHKAYSLALCEENVLDSSSLSEESQPGSSKSLGEEDVQISKLSPALPKETQPESPRMVIVWLYIGVTLASVHFILCVLLLYGAVMRVRRLLVPWMCMALVGLILCCTAMFVSMFLVRGTRALIIFVSSSGVISLGFYMWLVVYSHYIESGECKSCMSARTHVTLNNQNLNNTTSV